MSDRIEKARRACRIDPLGTFYRSIIVAEDGIVDIVADNSHDFPYHRLRGLKPGLWRTHIRHDVELTYAGAFWMTWICDGKPCDLLDQMIGERDIEDEMKQATLLRSTMKYIENLDWQTGGEEYGDTGGDYGIAIRSRHVLSAEFHDFFNDTRMPRIDVVSTSAKESWYQLPLSWRKVLERWYDCNKGMDHMEEDEAGAEIGGAIIGCDSTGYTISPAKDEDGKTIGILLGDMHEEGHYDSDEYDMLLHAEALDNSDCQPIRPILLKCIHGGDPHLEEESPNYLSSFDLLLNTDDLTANTQAVAAQRIAHHLVQNQRRFVNPYIDLSHILDGNCKCFIPIDPKRETLVSMDVGSTFWANLRRESSESSSESSPISTSLMYHLPRMYHVKQYGLPHFPENFLARITRSTRIKLGAERGVVEWTAPDHWHRPSRPNISPSEEYRLEPIFHYVGCGYALTPSSIYPPLKAAHIWRWVPPSADERHSRDEILHDPYQVFYEVGHYLSNIEDILGYTALLTTDRLNKANRKEHHFADIWGADPERGILYGWLRDFDRVDEFCAFTFPSSNLNDMDSFPPFRKIQVEAYGIPKQVPRSPPSLSKVSIVCRQHPSRHSPNLIQPFEITVPVKTYRSGQDLENDEILPSIANHLIAKKLLHPLFMMQYKRRLELAKEDRLDLLPIYLCQSDTDYLQAMAAYISSGQEPGAFGFTAEWYLSGRMCPREWPDSGKLPPPVSRQQPAMEAWKAPEGEGWYNPVKPDVDPVGQYECVDVMSYVGFGHVLPPWATYPPEKARYVWSRIDGKDTHVIVNKPYGTDKRPKTTNLLDCLGQTVIVNGWTIVDVIAIDRPRGLIFGFSRTSEDADEFVCFQLKDHLTVSAGDFCSGHDQELLHSGLEPAECDNIGLLFYDPEVFQVPPGGYSGFRPGRPCPGCSNCKGLSL